MSAYDPKRQFRCVLSSSVVLNVKCRDSVPGLQNQGADSKSNRGARANAKSKFAHRDANSASNRYAEADASAYIVAFSGSLEADMTSPL